MATHEPCADAGCEVCTLRHLNERLECDRKLACQHKEEALGYLQRLHSKVEPGHVHTLARHEWECVDEAIAALRRECDEDRTAATKAGEARMSEMLRRALVENDVSEAWPDWVYSVRANQWPAWTHRSALLEARAAIQPAAMRGCSVLPSVEDCGVCDSCKALSAWKHLNSVLDRWAGRRAQNPLPAAPTSGEPQR